MKPSNLGQRIADSKNFGKSLSQIKFNLSAQNLACFQGKQKPPLSKMKPQSLKDSKFLSLSRTLQLSRGAEEPNSPNKHRTLSCTRSFNETVVILQYDNIDVYIDNSAGKKSSSKGSVDSKKKQKKSQSDEAGDQFLESCVRVITEETDNTSNHLTGSTYQMTPPFLTPRSLDYCQNKFLYDMYDQRGRAVKAKKAVTSQENKNFVIDEINIENDGRTTVMVKNIPNKYTQEMLLQEITVNHQNKFDFFYLPIDKDNDSNVGYAFVNFVNASFLKDFYSEFNKQKWKRYKSPKICNICYARYQGTLQLADHFKHTKIINQKDRKVKPLIGVAEANILKIVKSQRKQE